MKLRPHLDKRLDTEFCPEHTYKNFMNIQTHEMPPPPPSQLACVRFYSLCPSAAPIQPLQSLNTSNVY
jgi:hypothetical protein